MRWIKSALCLCSFSLFIGCYSGLGEGQQQEQQAIHWTKWSPAVFEQARQEHRFVLLDVEAVWCHWCHVMDVNTYANPAVIALVNSKYIAVRVDQDSQPDLANRYEDYGWPATVVFSADKGEIVKRQGYIPPAEMISMLKAIIADPTPGPSVRPAGKIEFPEAAGLTPELRAHLEHKLQAGYDNRMGGWGFEQKYLDFDNVEYCMAHAGDNAGVYKKLARQTLDAERQLIDPVWGGVYQYSTDDDWKHPHFEKIMSMQAGNLRIYSLAYGLWGDASYRQTAQAIDHYLETFLTSPDGAFYTSQDADLIDGQHSTAYFALADGARRRQGIPRIDKHIYARENGWAINALALFSSMTGNTNQLARATRAADWIVAHRSLPGGGFRHDSHDPSGPYLADTLAMARAFLTLYETTADRRWLERAEAAVQFMARTFAANPGFATAVSDPQSLFRPQPQYDENVSMARLANLLSYYTGKKEYRAEAENALRWLSASGIADRRFSDVGGVLLADEELKAEPAHLTMVGSKHDLAARELWLAALKFPETYRRVEWYDPSEGPLPNPDVSYPTFPYAAAFVCTRGTCSSPIKNPAVLAKRIRRLAGN